MTRLTLAWGLLLLMTVGSFAVAESAGSGASSVTTGAVFVLAALKGAVVAVMFVKIRKLSLAGEMLFYAWLVGVGVAVIAINLLGG